MTDSLITRMAKLHSRLSRIPVKLGQQTTTLTFSINSGTLLTDADGISYNAPISLSIEVFLIASSNQILDKNQEVIWQNPSVVKVEGFCINPAFLPTTIRPSMVAQATVNNPDYPIAGKFLLLPSLQNEKTILAHNLKGLLLLNPGV